MTKRTRPILATLMALAAAGVLIAATAWVPPAAAGIRPARWTTVWRDDFAGRSGTRPDPARWQVDNGGQEAGDLEVYRDDPTNVGLDGHGNLRITATTDGGGFYSARLISVAHDLLPPPHGSLRIQARIKPAPDAGVGTSIWAWGNDVDSWPANGEIDIAEQLGKEPDRVHVAIQCPTCHETAPPFGLGTVYAAPDGRPYSDGFHTFAMRWNRDPDSISWYIDGCRLRTVTPADTGAAGWVFDQPMFLLLSVRVGGPFVGDPDPATLPATALIDSVIIARTAPDADASIAR